jgi:hypothetical protein
MYFSNICTPEPEIEFKPYIYGGTVTEPDFDAPAVGGDMLRIGCSARIYGWPLHGHLKSDLAKTRLRRLQSLWAARDPSTGCGLAHRRLPLAVLWAVADSDSLLVQAKAMCALPAARLACSQPTEGSFTRLLT